jgi:hypothetical protein
LNEWEISEDKNLYIKLAFNRFTLALHRIEQECAGKKSFYRLNMRQFEIFLNSIIGASKKM